MRVQSEQDIRIVEDRLIDLILELVAHCDELRVEIRDLIEMSKRCDGVDHLHRRRIQSDLTFGSEDHELMEWRDRETCER
jgi:hypothetical protein